MLCSKQIVSLAVAAVLGAALSAPVMAASPDAVPTAENEVPAGSVSTPAAAAPAAEAPAAETPAAKPTAGKPAAAGKKTAAKKAPAKAAQPKEKGPEVPKVTADDLDLWAFTAADKIAPAKTVEEFRALPNLAKESKDELQGAKFEGKDAPAPDATAKTGPVEYRFSYSDGVDVKVLDYGTRAFLTGLRVNGPEHPIKDDLKIGSPRAQIESVLGRPTRGSGSYVVYEGKSDVIRVFYTPVGEVRSLEIDFGG